MARRFSPRIVVALSILVAGFILLFSVGLRGSLVYYLTVGEYLNRQDRGPLDGNFRINGQVVEGSIEKPPSGLGARFVMTDGTRNLSVVFGKETPDTFVDGSEVVVEGSLGPDGVFVAHTLLAKCPSKYEAANTEEDYKRSDAEPASGTRNTGDSPQ